MTAPRHPLRGTLLAGLGFGLIVAVGLTVLPPVVPAVAVFKCLIWLCLAVYTVLMARWADKPFFPALFHLVLLAAIGLFLRRGTDFLVVSLLIFSWLRSGVLVSGPTLRKFFAELIFCGGGAVLLSLFAPRSATTWGLAVFLFFQIQCLYFFLVLPTDPKRNETDPFETARAEAEKLFSAGR